MSCTTSEILMFVHLYDCMTVSVLCLFLVVSWAGLAFVIVAFLGYLLSLPLLV